MQFKERIQASFALHPYSPVDSKPQHLECILTNLVKLDDDHDLELPDDEHLISSLCPVDTCFGCQDSSITKKECRQADSFLPLYIDTITFL